jgi:hypothetical protein
MLQPVQPAGFQGHHVEAARRHLRQRGQVVRGRQQRAALLGRRDAGRAPPKLRPLRWRTSTNTSVPSGARITRSISPPLQR